MSDLAHDLDNSQRLRRRLVPWLALSAVALFGLFLFGNAVHQLSKHRPMWSGVYFVAAVVLYGSAVVVARWHYARRP